MAEITATLVKTLREKTGAGMMDCKRALGETQGDLEEAIDWLRKKGLSAAAKKAGRVAAEGLVAVASSETSGSIVEINAETDFVARNEQFQDFVKSVATLSLIGNNDLEALKTTKLASGMTVQETLTSLVATIGENMNFRRSQKLSVSEGVVATYVHNAVTAGLGKIGVLVALESKGDKIRLNELGRQIAMHIAAANPLFLNIESVDTVSLERERQIFTEQASASGKPPAVIEKMVEGRIRKYYEESVLLEQVFVIDGENKISKVIDTVAKEIGMSVKMTGFLRYALGEGIDKEDKDFAAEVAAQLGKS